MGDDTLYGVFVGTRALEGTAQMQTTTTTMTTQEFPSTTSDGVAAAHAHPDSANHYASSSGDSQGNFQKQQVSHLGQLNRTDQRVSSRWNRVEPWHTFLCREGGGKEEGEGADEGRRRGEELQVRFRAISHRFCGRIAWLFWRHIMS